MATLFHTQINPKKDLRKQVVLWQVERLYPWKETVTKIDEARWEKILWRDQIPTIMILKMMILQFIYGISDEWVEEDMYDRATFRWFVWEELLLKHGVPDATTLCRFRRLLEEHNLHETIFEVVLKKLEEKWAYLKRWTAVDGTIIQAPSSTKNDKKERDKEMKSTKKWANYQFGMKIHQWTDIDTGIVHSLSFTAANEHDSTQFTNCLHGEEQIYGWDKWYANQEFKKQCRAEGKVYAILDKAPRVKKWEKAKQLSVSQKKRNKKWQSLKAKVEKPFWILKKWWWNKKTRYKGLYKNEVWLTIAMSVWNVFLWGWRMKKKWIIQSL